MTGRIDRWLLATALLLLAGGAWVTTVTTTGADGLASMDMPRHHHSELSPAAVGATWMVMMVAMMAPAAAPIALTYATVVGRSDAARRALALTASLVGGYLLVWTVFAIAAAMTQAQLTRLGILQPGAHALGSQAGGLLLVVAGAYQLTPLKHSCLRRCRTPLGFLLHHWRDGISGAAAIGARHGAWCIGCCCMLMALLFAVGTMNTAWMALISALVIAERSLNRGYLLARLAGLALIGWGAYRLGSVAVPALAAAAAPGS